MNEAAPSIDPKVAFRKITGKTVRTICNLSISEEQRKLVAPNAMSIAQAYFAKSAWFRAIYADETPIGFVMLAEDPTRGKHLSLAVHDRRKASRQRLRTKSTRTRDQTVRKDPKARELYLSVVRAKGSAEDLYRSFGSEFTGKVDHGEHAMKFDLRKRRSSG